MSVYSLGVVIVGKICCWTLYCPVSVGHKAPSAILTRNCATSTPYKAASTFGFCAAATTIAAFSVEGASLSTAEAEDSEVCKGDKLGWFQHGSTIIVFAPDGFALCQNVREGATIRMGEPLMRLP